MIPSSYTRHYCGRLSFYTYIYIWKISQNWANLKSKLLLGRMKWAYFCLNDIRSHCLRLTAFASITDERYAVVTKNLFTISKDVLYPRWYQLRSFYWQHRMRVAGEFFFSTIKEFYYKRGCTKWSLLYSRATIRRIKRKRSYGFNTTNIVHHSARRNTHCFATETTNTAIYDFFFFFLHGPS